MLYRWQEGSLIDRDTGATAADCGDSLTLPLLRLNHPFTTLFGFKDGLKTGIINLITREHQQSKQKYDKRLQENMYMCNINFVIILPFDQKLVI